MTIVHKYSEQELVTLLKDQQGEAFSYLYDHYSGALYAAIFAIVNDQQLASDVLQETFINIFRRIDSYDDKRSRLYTWMLNIARNAAIDLVRSKGFRQMKQNQHADGIVYASNTNHTPNIDHIGLRKTLLQLNENHRQVLDLAYFGGFTQEEIGEMLKMPTGTVKTRVRAALKKLRQLMQ